jgi:hypothetical protein
MSGCVSLRLSSPEAVVTWFVTAFRTFFVILWPSLADLSATAAAYTGSVDSA